MDNNTKNTTGTQQTPTGVIRDTKGKHGGFFNKNVLLIIFILIFIPSIIYFFSTFNSGGSKRVTLVYWGIWEPSTVFADLISGFQKQHPDISVVYEKQDVKSLGQYIDRLSAKEASENVPDIFRFHNSWVPEVKAMLLPFPKNVVDATQLDTEYYPVIKKDLKVNGAYYGIPLEIDTLSLFINDDLFKQAGIAKYPTDWDSLLSDAKTLTVQDQNNNISTAGIAMGWYDNVDHASDILSLLFIQNGASLRKLTDPLTIKNARDALLFYTWFSGGLGNHIWDDRLDHSKLAFSKGKVAMIFGYSWDILDIKALNPNLKFTVVPVPHLPQKSMTIASYWAEGVSAKTKHPKEAFEFLQFLTQKENLEKLYQNQAKLRLFGEPYPRTDMAGLLHDNPYLSPIVSQANDAVSTIFSSDTYDGSMVTSLTGYLGDTVHSIEGGVGSVGTSLDILGKGVDSIMQKYEPPPPKK